ncbi:MAG: class I SAM-dependent methyltransferase [Anaerolineae bacterium]|nr:class I SAM-dependent methyltransferase [Anaerolineae bacterium]
MGLHVFAVIPLLILISVLVLIAFVIWWLLIRTEGVYLGKRVVIWLYDVYASRYDGIVQHDTVEEHLHIAAPLMKQLDSQTYPLVLDVATGTGRIPLALCHHARFEGHIVALDLSRKMLTQAVAKIQAEHFEDYVTFIWADGSQIPFDDNSFDVVTCMEALEFMPNPEEALHELVRVLRPNGILLTTHRINERLMPHKLWSEAEMQQILASANLTNIVFEAWQYDYSKVWAIKSGKSDFIGARPLDGMLRCPCCEGYMVNKNGAWVCENCNSIVPIQDNIINLHARI